jgi:hypothetical protein
MKTVGKRDMEVVGSPFLRTEARGDYRDLSTEALL